MNPDVGILTIALKAFLDEFIAGYGRIHASAERLLHLLGLIDLGLAALFALWARSEEGLSWLAQKAMVYGFWIFLVAQWMTLMPTVIDGFIWVGLRAGGSAMTVQEFTNPSAIAGLGMVATEPLWNHIRNYGWNFWKHAVDITLCGVLGLVILCSFFAIAIEVFVFFLQFYVFAVLTTILLPFGINRYTSWIADGCMSTLLAHGIKVMVLAMVTSVVFPMIHRFVVSPNPTWGQLVGMAVGMVALALLCWLAPQKAVGMFTHGPQLTAGVFASSTVGTAVVIGTVGSGMGHGARSVGKRVGSMAPRRKGAAGPRSGGVRPQTP
jgi:type IV secretion system protein TrbL